MSSIELKMSIFEMLTATKDSKLIRSIYQLLKSNVISQDDITLSVSQIKELDRRMKDHQSGKSKSYTWEEAKKMIRASK